MRQRHSLRGVPGGHHIRLDADRQPLQAHRRRITRRAYPAAWLKRHAEIPGLARARADPP
jgi:hypothetical protein